MPITIERRKSDIPALARLKRRAADRLPAPAASQLYEEGITYLGLFDTEGYERAVACFREALMIDPSFGITHAGLAEAYAHWGFRREIESMEFQSYLDLAFEHAERAVGMHPDRAESHVAMAMAVRRGNHEDTERRKTAVMIALELDPKNVRAWYEYWRAFGYHLTDPSLARVLDLDPKFFAAHHDRAVVLCEEGKHHEAEQAFLKALSINPTNSLCLHNLAMLYSHHGLKDRAMEVLTKAREYHPELPLIDRGIELLQDGRSTSHA